jgi:hypothetical protein
MVSPGEKWDLHLFKTSTAINDAKVWLVECVPYVEEVLAMRRQLLVRNIGTNAPTAPPFALGPMVVRCSTPGSQQCKIFTCRKTQLLQKHEPFFSIVFEQSARSAEGRQIVDISSITLAL